MADYTTYKTEDFLLDESFVAFCKGDDSEATHFWENLLLEYPAMLPEVIRARKLYSILSVSTPAEQKSGLVSQVKNEIASGKYDEAPVYQMNSRRKIGWLRYVAAAAVITMLVTAALWWHNASSAAKYPTVADYANAHFKETIAAGESERREVQLPDGSVALLNNGSVLKIADNFNRSDRWIYLEGEAFFSVKKDAEKPFVVITAKTATTALGTSFKVRNYPGETEGNVMLATGKVKVESLIKNNDKRNDIELLPGEEANWNGDDSPVKSAFDQETLLDWRSTRIIFEKANLAKIIQTLQFYYGVQVMLVNKPRMSIAFTGKFYGKSLRDVLEAIGFANKFNYWQKGNIVSIVF